MEELNRVGLDIESQHVCPKCFHNIDGLKLKVGTGCLVRFLVLFIHSSFDQIFRVKSESETESYKIRE